MFLVLYCVLLIFTIAVATVLTTIILPVIVNSMSYELLLVIIVLFSIGLLIVIQNLVKVMKSIDGFHRGLSLLHGVLNGGLIGVALSTNVCFDIWFKLSYFPIILRVQIFIIDMIVLGAIFLMVKNINTIVLEQSGDEE